MDDKWKNIIEYIQIWYESYINIIRYLGAISAGLLAFTTTNLFNEIFFEELFSDNQYALSYIKYSFVMFAASLVMVFICLLATYNWFVTGVDRVLKQTGVEIGELGDDFSYRNKLGSMGFWGKISFVSGVVVGILVLVGIILYTIGISDIINSSLQFNIMENK